MQRTRRAADVRRLKRSRAGDKRGPGDSSVGGSLIITVNNGVTVSAFLLETMALLNRKKHVFYEIQ